MKIYCLKNGLNPLTNSIINQEYIFIENLKKYFHFLFYFVFYQDLI